jgi:hypothetical protein
LAFDIIGDLAFGESFGAVEHVKSHPWAITIKDSVHSVIFADIFQEVPLIKLLPALIWSGKLPGKRKKQFRLSREKVERRMQMVSERMCFFGRLLSQKESVLSPGFLTAQANALVIAGSKTTATFLFGRSAVSS